MKVVAPKSFTLEGGKRAVLLLHGFTGSTKDVKRLGQYLQKKAILVMHLCTKDTVLHRKNCY